MKSFTDDQLKKLIASSFEEGQIQGIKLACESLIEAIQAYKKRVTDLYIKENKNETI